MTEVWFNTIYRDGLTIIQAKIKDLVFESISMNYKELQIFWEKLR